MEQQAQLKQTREIFPELFFLQSSIAMVPEEIMTDVHTLENCSDARQPCLPQTSPDDFSVAMMSSLHASAYMMRSSGNSCHFIFY